MMKILNDIVKQDDESQKAFEAKIRLRVTWSFLLGSVLVAGCIILATVYSSPINGVVALVLLGLGFCILECIWKPARNQLRSEEKKKDDDLVKEVFLN